MTDPEARRPDDRAEEPEPRTDAESPAFDIDLEPEEQGTAEVADEQTA